MKIEREELKGTVERMKSEGFDYLVKITAVDYLDRLDVIYFLRNTAASKDEELEVSLPASDAWIYTIMDNYGAADWYEREVYEMFGIEFRGRRVKRLLLEKWDGIDPPLRKSFAWNAPYRTSEGNDHN